MTKKDEIRLDPKHGLNPSVALCFICGESWGVLLLGYQNGKEAPRQITHDFCDQCKQHMAAGAILCIEIKDNETGNNPFRTGRIFGVKREAFERIFTLPGALEKGFCFIPENVVTLTGMDKVKPTEEEPHETPTN